MNIKTCLLLIIIFFSSCSKDNYIVIKNKDLINEIDNLLKIINKHKPCKSEYISVEIEEKKIYISNNKPVDSEDFIGFTNYKNSKIYFYSKTDYSDYIIVNNKNDFIVDDQYSNNCHPSLELILNKK